MTPATPRIDLAVVSSPLQYMNAVEWRASVGGGPCDLVLIGDRHRSDHAIAALRRRRDPFGETFEVERRPRPLKGTPAVVKDLLDLRHRAALKRLAARLAGRGYGRVAFGDYRNVSQRLLIARLAKGEATLLDDGSVTPQSAAFRAAPQDAAEPGQFDLRLLRTLLAMRLFGDAPPQPPARLTFFTIYGPLIEPRLAASDRTEPNGYEVWRRSAASAPRGDAVWLLGANHGEAGITSPQDYRALVLGAAARLRAEGRTRIVYRPHRGQGAEVAAELASAAGMLHVPSTAPVELDYLEAAERPAAVVVVASSAADTLAVLDPDLDIVRIALPSGYLRRRAEHIRQVVAGHDAFNPRLRVIDVEQDPPVRP